MIIDTHTHVYPEAVAAKATENLGHFYDFPVEGKGTLTYANGNVYTGLFLDGKRTAGNKCRQYAYKQRFPFQSFVFHTVSRCVPNAE